tara:strand:- start:225 stop:347 length:123 start_codon:yes stop_codon:yes gene_type:complete
MTARLFLIQLQGEGKLFVSSTASATLGERELLERERRLEL